jgi:hypothetical protein
MPAVRADGFEAVAMLKPIIADRAPPPKGLAPLAVPLSVERHREWCFRSDAPKSSGNTIALATANRLSLPAILTGASGSVEAISRRKSAHRPLVSKPGGCRFEVLPALSSKDAGESVPHRVSRVHQHSLVDPFKSAEL